MPTHAHGSFTSPVVERHLHSESTHQGGCYILITPKILFGECLISGLRRQDGDSTYECFGSMAAFRSRVGQPATIIMLHMSASTDSGMGELDDAVASLREDPDAPILAVISDIEDPSFILQTLTKGAKAFIPTNLTLAVAAQALKLVAAGGSFIPWTVLTQASARPPVAERTDVELSANLSSKEIQVAKELRKGTPNKIIAYQLNMCESTVKVHVRNIMKKFNARNRTQVAYLCSEVYGGRVVLNPSALKA